MRNHVVARSLAAIVLIGFSGSLFAAEPIVIDLWPGQAPGEASRKPLPAEADQTKPTDNLIAGRRIIKLGNVSKPTLAIYRPEAGKETGAAVVICPGGGHHILAYDLEGTEVAEWLNTFGVTGIVLKYRVPARDPERRWHAAVQDAQRAMSVVRHRASEWGIDPGRIGICGFSAGGETAGRAAILLDQRQYDPADAADKVSSRPDFALLIYPAYFANKEGTKLRDDLVVTKEVPPTFFVHAFDDPVTAQSTLLLAAELKRVGGSAEVHVFASGGHGYGLRPTDQPVTRWPALAEAWMRNRKLLAPASK